MTNVFLSYADEDRAHAERIAKGFQAAGLSVWWDRVIPAGRAYDDVIEEAIDGASVVVVLWSPRSVASDWVRTEAQEGAARGVLVPVVIEDTKIPLAFRRIQTVPLTEWNGDSAAPDFARLVSDVHTVLGGGTLAIPTPTPGYVASTAPISPAAATPQEPQSVERLTAGLADRFEIEGELGAGGMAVVYRARDIQHERIVAIKVMRPELTATFASERFLREIRIAANLTHPNILPVHESGDANGVLYYVMPFVEGESLKDLLSRDGPMPIARAVELIRDIASALDYAHGKGVIHRDLKPDNILISDGRAILADFGIARAAQVAEQERLTGTGMAIGTPEYMSPEQATGNPDVDHRADIYALGVMAYAMLTGHGPFTGTSQQEILVKHLTEDPPPVSTRRSDIPDALADSVMTCLNKKPDERWQSAGAFADGLKGGSRVVSTAADSDPGGLSATMQMVEDDATVPHEPVAVPPPPDPPATLPNTAVTPEPKTESPAPEGKRSPVLLVVGVVLVAGAGYAGMQLMGGRAAVDTPVVTSDSTVAPADTAVPQPLAAAPDLPTADAPALVAEPNPDPIEPLSRPIPGQAQMAPVHASLDRLIGPWRSDQDFELIGDYHDGSLDDDAVGAFHLDLEQGYVYRIAGVCDADCLDMDLRMTDDVGGLVAEDVLRDSIPILSVFSYQTLRQRVQPSMPDCAREPCLYSVAVLRKPLSQAEQQVGNELRAGRQLLVDEGFRQAHLHSGLADAGATEEFSINLSGGVSYALYGVCDNDCANMNMIMSTSSGQEVGRDTMKDARPIIRYTPPADGAFTVQVQMVGCSVRNCNYAVMTSRR